MAEITLEKILEEVNSLPPNEKEALIDALLQPVIRPRKTIEQLVAEQGKKPLNFAELRRLGKFFPEDESVDDLVRTVREWRDVPSTRNLD